MNCLPVQAWLLTARPDEAAPGPVARHLRACPRCRRVRGRLGQLALDDPPPALSPEARDRLLARLGPAPVPGPPWTAPPSRPHSASPAPRRRTASALALAAALLLGLGLG